MQALLTRLVAPEEQGRLQGALASVMSVAAVLAPVLFTQVFGAGIRLLGRPGSGAALLLAALVLVATASIAARATRPARDEPVRENGPPAA
jgi:DHA1 family tetracycline resistance protein-like MFS transporter